MVPRPRLLLSALLLCGCPAEMLGVELPRGGPDAISQEDLQRDTWLLQRAADRPAAAAALAGRLAEMRVLPAFGTRWTQGEGQALVVCGRKEGADEAAWVLVALGPPEEAAGALAWAGVISVAKGYDQPGRPAHTVLLCATATPEGLATLAASPPVALERAARVRIVEGLHGARLEERAAALGPAEAVALAGLGAPPADAGAVDYRLAARHARALYAALAAP